MPDIPVSTLQIQLQETGQPTKGSTLWGEHPDSQLWESHSLAIFTLLCSVDGEESRWNVSVSVPPWTRSGAPTRNPHLCHKEPFVPPCTFRALPAAKVAFNLSEVFVGQWYPNYLVYHFLSQDSVMGAVAVLLVCQSVYFVSRVACFCSFPFTFCQGWFPILHSMPQIAFFIILRRHFLLSLRWLFRACDPQPSFCFCAQSSRPPSSAISSGKMGTT